MPVAEKRETFLIEPSRWRADALGYGVAMTIVAAAFLVLAIALGRARTLNEASEVDDAIMIDLPPAAASSPAPGDAKDGPEQQPAPASAAPPPPEEVQPPQKPLDAPREAKAEPTDGPPPPVRDPAAVLDRRREEASPPPEAAAAPTAAPREERAPTGADAPSERDESEGDEARPHASTHAITLWQKTLMRRLEIAKRALRHEAGSAGTVRIAFEIDGKGALVSERIAESSGSASLDGAASTLVRLAAPFPAPPPGAGPADLSFVVPIRFRR